MRFELLARDGPARRGRIETAHGAIDTPAFMPVGTQGTVKSLSPEEVAQTGAQVLLGNTFHLLLRPGPEVVAAHGGRQPNRATVYRWLDRAEEAGL